MKRQIRTVALCAALGLLAAGCQKENVEAFTTGVSDVYTMSYSVDGVDQTTTMDSAVLDEFVNRMFDMAEQGHIVTIGDKGMSAFAAKETVTYTTNDRTDAVNWTVKMKNDGYTVTVSYDKGVYTCIAVK